MERESAPAVSISKWERPPEGTSGAMTTEEASKLYRERVLGWARRSGVPKDDADDVAQDVFRLFDRRRARIRDDAAASWLRTATRRVSKRYRQRLARRREHERPVGEREHAGPAPSPERVLGERQVEAAILDFVAGLEPARREVFVRHVLGEEPIEDIARDQGVPLGTAWNRLRLARLDLRDALEAARAAERRRARGFTSFALAPLFFLSGWFRGLWRRRAVRRFVRVLGALAALALLAPLADLGVRRLAGLGEEQLAPAVEEPIAGRRVEVAPFLPFAFVEAPHEREGVPAASAPVDAPASGAAELPEAALVALARRALTEGSPSRARAYLDRADRAYPAGTLRPERAQLRARAAP